MQPKEQGKSKGKAQEWDAMRAEVVEGVLCEIIGFNDCWYNSGCRILQLWTRIAAGRQAATWNTPWETNPSTLYNNLPKHQSTALMLLRTEVIGLNDWLSSIGVRDVLPRCDCGWPRQTNRGPNKALNF